METSIDRVTRKNLEDCLQELYGTIRKDYEFTVADEEYFPLLHTLLRIFTETFGTENYDTLGDTGCRENISSTYSDLEISYQGSKKICFGKLKNYLDPSKEANPCVREASDGLHPFSILCDWADLCLSTSSVPSCDVFAESLVKINNRRLPLEHAMSFLEINENATNLIFTKYSRREKNFNIFQWGVYADDIIEWAEIMKIQDV